MAQGPDPNRWPDTDPEAAGGNLGDVPSTRFGLSSWIIAALVVILVIGLLVVWSRS
jgi:hypothetical protein